MTNGILVRHIPALPRDFGQLRAEASAEGFRHIETLWEDWQSGHNRFAAPGERLYCATLDGALAGIGGITEDFLDRTGLRMRRFYIRPAFRRRGVASAIANEVLAHALPLHRPIWLYADTPEAGRFWEGMGFVPAQREKTTHVWPTAASLPRRSANVPPPAGRQPPT